MHERPNGRIARHNEALSESTEDIVTTYQPRLIGAGNEHLVYEVAEHPDVVVKVNKTVLESSIRWCMHNNATAEEMFTDPDVSRQIDDRLREYRAGLAEMTAYFGRVHVARSRIVKFRTPLLPAVLAELKLKGEDLPKETYAFALIQEKIEDMRDLPSLHAWYPTEETSDIFSAKTAAAILRPYNMISGLHIDEAHASSIRDFVERAVSYSHDTGRILDLAGPHNVILDTNPDTNEPSYRLVDALFPVTWEKFIEEFQSDAAQFLQNSEFFPAQNRSSRILNTANYIRFVNDLAAATASPHRLTPLANLPEDNHSQIKDMLLLAHEIYLERQNSKQNPENI